MLIPTIIKSKAINTSTLNFGEFSKNILDTKYIKIIFNEIIIPTRDTSGENLIECVNAILKLYPINPSKNNNRSVFPLSFFGVLHFYPNINVLIQKVQY